MTCPSVSAARSPETQVHRPNLRRRVRRAGRRASAGSSASRTRSTRQYVVAVQPGHHASPCGGPIFLDGGDLRPLERTGLVRERASDNRMITGGSPFVLPDPEGDVLVGDSDIQTFYLATTGPNLIFHAGDAHQVWFPAAGLVDSRDGTIRTSLGHGTRAPSTRSSRWSTGRPPRSWSRPPTSDQIARPVRTSSATRSCLTRTPESSLSPGRSPPASRPSTRRSRRSSRGSARTPITRRTSRLCPRVPTLSTNSSSGTASGYCEQISTALTVMLRTLGIPAREAVGYVPGPYDPITDLYDIQASDAHAWVQVWFPYYGWQSFDPTAVVPLANPSSARVLLHDVAAVVERAPWVPVGIPLAALLRRRYGDPRMAAQAGDLGADRWRAGWSASVLEHALPRRPGETLTEFATRLDDGVRRPFRDAREPWPSRRSCRLRPARATTRGARPVRFDIAAGRPPLQARSVRFDAGQSDAGRNSSIRAPSLDSARAHSPSQQGETPDRMSPLR